MYVESYTVYGYVEKSWKRQVEHNQGDHNRFDYKAAQVSILHYIIRLKGRQ